MSMRVRVTRQDDAPALLKLYQRVARNPGGLARREAEIDIGYIDGFLSRAQAAGVSYVAESDAGELIAEMHAYSPGIECFSHVLSELTIAVDPQTQGSGVGRRLFVTFMRHVVDSCPDITRVELIVRQSNNRAIRFYESLGFQREGMLGHRIRNTDGSLEADIPMAWIRGEAG
ncbi:MAG TPA: GNAT family N-acetyltransferase [Woeseiaceae bacterium]|nr:GNAT family N-acetyltransferase [Woeseiaceae bacterium]